MKKISSKILSLLVCLFVGVISFAPSISAGELPRFVSLGSDHVYGRSGPGKQYPIKWEYKKKNLPVEIIMEYEHWRRIKDPDGELVWVHKTLLSGARYGLVDLPSDVKYDFLYKDDEAKHAIARLGQGLVVKIVECDKAMCKAEYSGFDGWVKRKIIWGIYPNENMN